MEASGFLFYNPTRLISRSGLILIPRDFPSMFAFSVQKRVVSGHKRILHYWKLIKHSNKQLQAQI